MRVERAENRVVCVHGNRVGDVRGVDKKKCTRDVQDHALPWTRGKLRDEKYRRKKIKCAGKLTCGKIK